MFKIDQEVLCDFCRCHYEKSNSWHCEGTGCEKIEEIYLRDKGISKEGTENKTFRKITMGDKIYLLKHEQIMPEIKECNINSITLVGNEPLWIHYESNSFKVARENMDRNRAGSYFLDKKDCKKALEDLCMERILNLSKIIGSN